MEGHRVFQGKDDEKRLSQPDLALDKDGYGAEGELGDSKFKTSWVSHI